MTKFPLLDGVITKLMALDQESALALADIAVERVRQIEAEGWTPQHDDAHSNGEMAQAAACYAVGSTLDEPQWGTRRMKTLWPWDIEWWKPKSPQRNKLRAAALLLAELARIQRMASIAARP